MKVFCLGSLTFSLALATNLVTDIKKQKGDAYKAINDIGQNNGQRDKDQQENHSVPIGHRTLKYSLKCTATFEPVQQTEPSECVNETVESFEDFHEFIHCITPLH